MTTDKKSEHSETSREPDVVPSLDKGGSRDAPSKLPARVTGQIVLEHGAPAANVTVRLYQREFGGKRTVLGEAKTNAEGHYSLTYAPTSETRNIEVYLATGGGETQISTTKYNASVNEKLDLVAPSILQPAAPEFARLRDSIAPLVGGKPEALRSAAERGGQRDFTLLAESTGWDSAALAMASEAYETAAKTSIPADGLYALARAGIPMSPALLAGVPKQSIATALGDAVAAGIIDSSTIESTAATFDKFVGERRLQSVVPGTRSNPSAFLAKSGVSASDAAAFTQAFQASSKPSEIWEQAAASGVSAAGIAKLQLQGKLAYLTFNNAELTAQLLGEVADVTGLVNAGYYESAKWDSALRKIAGADAAALDALVPTLFAGTREERLAAYVTELSRRTRNLDPHAVTVARVASGTIAGLEGRDGVARFLKNAVPLGFKLGSSPLGRFVVEKGDPVWAGIDPKDRDSVLSEVRTLSALYSASPSDEALSGLLQAGFKSSSAIAKYDLAGFLEKVKPYVSDTTVTTKIYYRALQISATVYNVFDGLKRLSVVPFVPGSSGADVQARADQVLVAKQKLTGLYPTVEGLFGSADYCACDACRSVLSPAAYLVDILNFVDPNDEAWATEKALFEARTGKPYTKGKPFDVLDDRRPDIKNIALTCENTNTELPYIDIVNEILEQLMMSKATPPSIEAYDVGEASSADLVAEPQNVLWEAYVGKPGTLGLRDRVFPNSLPFDLPVEMVRAFLAQLGVPLHQLRETVTRPSKLEPAAVQADGWTDVWFERLGLTPKDVAAITRANAWFELYGYATEADALKTQVVDSVTSPAPTSLRNAKTLARSIDVSYVDLVEIVRTRFVNPNIESSISLESLEVDPHVVDQWVGGTLSMSEKNALIAHLQPLGLVPDDLAPLRTDAIRKTLVTLRSPSEGCDFSQTTLDFDLAPSNADESMVFVLRKINAFVRLQKKLDWEIHELDRVLTSLVPGGTMVDAATLPNALRTVLCRFAHVEELRARFSDRVTREEIAVLWSDIPTTGISCLYERLFLSSSDAGSDRAFAKRLGVVLSNNAVLLRDHVDAVRQAFEITDSDVALVVAADAPLSTANLSKLMRHAILARGLDVSVDELVRTLGVSARTPLDALAQGTIATLADDKAWNETVAFVRGFSAFADAGVDLSFVERICRHRGVPEEAPPDADPTLVALAALPTDDSDATQSLVVQTLAAQVSSPFDVVDRLVRTVLHQPDAKPLIEGGFATGTVAMSLRKLRKAIDLVQSLDLTDAELAYLIGLGALSLDTLPLVEVADDPTARGIASMLGPWLVFVAVRRELGQAARLLDVIRAARQPVDAANTVPVRTAMLQGTLSALTGLKLPIVTAGLAALGIQNVSANAFEVPALMTAEGIHATVAALRVFGKLGMNPADVVTVASAEIDQGVAKSLRSAVKSRYTTSSWQRLAKTIFDPLRAKQRDALVAHLTHVTEAGVPKYGDTLEKLFEFLLIDAGMEPVVLASRIQLATAAVQQFIARCIANAERDGVDSQIIDRDRWTWMERYRVWEANRKIFIWPENWLDPEFRDDKSHLFRALEGELLQADVNDDLVRNSLFTYLKGLEEIARLDMMTMYLEPGESADGMTVHVVGRTQNAPYKYFYRKAFEGMWTPWEPIDVGIEGEHLVLTSWRGRLHLLWLGFHEQTGEGKNVPASFTPSTGSVTTGDLRPTTSVRLQLHWVEQVNGAWANRNSTSFVDGAFDGAKATSDSDKRQFFVHAALVEKDAGDDDDLLEFHITYGDTSKKFQFFSKLAPPTFTSGSEPDSPPFVNIQGRATKWRGGAELQPLMVSFTPEVDVVSTGKTTSSGLVRAPILTGGRSFTLLFPTNRPVSVDSREPVAGVGVPSLAHFEAEDAVHLVYRSPDGGVYDLIRANDGWFHTAPLAEAVDPAGDAEAANGDPVVYASGKYEAIFIAYAGVTKLHELVFEVPAGKNFAMGWRVDTIYESADDASRPVGRPLGIVTQGRTTDSHKVIVFRTKDGSLRQIISDLSRRGEAAVAGVLTAPKAASDPMGVVWHVQKPGNDTWAVLYIGVDAQIHELLATDTFAWQHTVVTKTIDREALPISDSQVSVFVDAVQRTPYVAYRGKGGSVHLLQRSDQSWTHTQLPKVPKAKGDPVGYCTDDGSLHIVYQSEDGNLVELERTDAWRVTHITKNKPSESRNFAVAAIDDESIGAQLVTSFDGDGRLHIFRSAQTTWRKESASLANPFREPIGPLAAPFFYESIQKDHAFFVEPNVAEYSALEWLAWVVTTETKTPIVRASDITALHPRTVAFTPSEQSLLKPPPPPERLYLPGTVVRTSKGVIDPTGPRAAARVPSQIVDLRRGTVRAFEKA